tara:strand:- start:226 stop:1422 length:1197 start_codon:yes stop_codon:yes gene_type:complete
MSYIGKIPATGNFVKLDAISVVNGQASYTMQSNSVNFTPESANHMLVSLNGVIQAPITSFSVSGSTITFASALSTGDVINFIMVYGNVLDIGTPSDDTISTAKLQNTSVTAGKLATDSVETAKIQNDAVTTDKINLISTSSTPSLEAKGTAGQTDGYIQLNCEQNSHGIKLKSPPHSAGQSYTMVYPATNITAGKFLKVDSISGSGATAVGTMSFADAGGGQWTHLLTQTASNSSSLDFSSTYITTTYLDYMFVFSGIKNASDGQYVRLLFSTDNGSNYANDYRNARMGFMDNGSEYNSGQSGSGGLYIMNSQPLGNSTGEAFNGVAIVYDPLKQNGTTDSFTYVTAHTSYCADSGSVNVATTSHCNKVVTAVNNIRFDTTGGNITSGKVSLYGRKLS